MNSDAIPFAAPKDSLPSGQTDELIGWISRFGRRLEAMRSSNRDRDLRREVLLTRTSVAARQQLEVVQTERRERWRKAVSEGGQWWKKSMFTANQSGGSCSCSDCGKCLERLYSDSSSLKCACAEEEAQRRDFPTLLDVSEGLDAFLEDVDRSWNDKKKRRAKADGGVSAKKAKLKA